MAAPEAAEGPALVVEIPRKDSEESNGSAWLLSTANADSVQPCERQPDTCSERELFGGMKLLVATFFCLLWNVTGVVIVMTCSKYYVQNSESRDVSKILTLVLAAVPFMCVGSILLWLVMVEWCKHLRTIKFCTLVTSQCAEKVSGNAKAEVLVLKPPPLAAEV